MLKDKVIVVTGGAGLIGREFITTIIENSGIAIIADISEGTGLKVKSDLMKKLNTCNIDFIKLDITCINSLGKCINYLDNKYGKIDAIVNNAYPRGRNYGESFFDVQYDDFVESVGMNIGGYFLTSQQFSKYFKGQGYGNIVNISSVYGVIAPNFEIYKNTPMTTPVEYVAIKSGLIQLTKYMAKYFKGSNIRVNSLSPGGILDNQPKSFLDAYNKKCLNKGMLDKSDLNGTLVYLLSDMSKYVNGQNIIIDDGYVL
jgi:NAD(P)-dependent dehydrogenase (short-subunit alcohol dehydrogenase family)